MIEFLFIYYYFFLYFYIFCFIGLIIYKIFLVLKLYHLKQKIKKKLIILFPDNNEIIEHYENSIIFATKKMNSYLHKQNILSFLKLYHFFILFFFCLIFFLFGFYEYSLIIFWFNLFILFIYSLHGLYIIKNYNHNLFIDDFYFYMNKKYKCI
jgi:hypothetical protein